MTVEEREAELARLGAIADSYESTVYVYSYMEPEFPFTRITRIKEITK